MSEPCGHLLLRGGLSYDRPDGVAAAVEEIFALAPAVQALGPQSKVLLKPNLLAKHPPEHAVTTHPVVVAAVIDALHRRGVTQITLADSSGGLYTEGGMRAVYRASGLLEVCERMGVAVWGKTTSGTRVVEGTRVHQFTLIDPVLECDFLIDLAKLKTHVMTGMTAGVKNLFGCIPGLQKAEMHMRFPQREDFGEMLCDLCCAVQPQLVIVDGITAMEGNGPAGGTVREEGLLLGGDDVWQLDLAVAQLMGLDSQRVPYLAAGARRGLCGTKLDPAALAPGSDPVQPLKNWQLPQSFRSLTFQEKFPTGLRWAGPLVSRIAAPRPVIRKSKCIGCGRCAEICPGKTIRLQNHKAVIDPAGCIRCFCCHEMCPAKALDVRRIAFFKL